MLELLASSDRRDIEDRTSRFLPHGHGEMYSIPSELVLPFRDPHLRGDFSFLGYDRDSLAASRVP